MPLTDFDFYDFGPFRLDTREKTLRRDGVEIPLTPKLYDLLAVLVSEPGRTFEKAELMQRVWGDAFVEEASLARGMSRLRMALGADGVEGELIKTVARRGYRFVAEVKPGRSEAGSTTVPRFSTVEADAVDIAPQPRVNGRARSRTMAWAAATLAVVAGIAATVWLTRQPARATFRRPPSPAAHEAYLRGQSLISRLTADRLRRGIEYLTRAVELDPDYAKAYAALALAHINSVDLITTPVDAFPRARMAAERALALDDTLADAYAMLATIAMQFERDWTQAERHYQRAIEIDPDHSFARVYYGWLLALTGRFAEGRAQVDYARRIDPLSIDVAITSSQIPYYERNTSRAETQTRETLELNPDFWLAHVMLGRVLELRGDTAGAIGEFERASQLEGGVPEALMDLGRAYARAGRTADARNLLQRLDQESQRGHVAPFHRAVIFMGLGDNDQAFRLLNEAADQRSWYLSWLKVEPMLDPLRTDARYAALLERAGFGTRNRE